VQAAAAHKQQHGHTSRSSKRSNAIVPEKAARKQAAAVRKQKNRESSISAQAVEAHKQQPPRKQQQHASISSTLGAVAWKLWNYASRRGERASAPYKLQAGWPWQHVPPTWLARRGPALHHFLPRWCYCRRSCGRRGCGGGRRLMLVAA
jgi:hypothetical protein